MYDDATLWKLLDGELDAATTVPIEAAAKSDAALRQRLDAMREIKRSVLDGAPTPPPGFAGRVAEASLTAPPAPILDLEEARMFLKRALVAAAILAALGLAYLVVQVVPQILDQQLFADPLLPGK